MESTTLHNVLGVLVIFNMVAAVIRILVRMRAVWFVSNARLAALVPVRWLVANVINTLALFRAQTQYYVSRWTHVAPKWVKTEHEIPEGFLEVEPAAPRTVKVGALAVLLALTTAVTGAMPERAEAKPLDGGQCVQIFYDRSPDPAYAIGKTYAMFLQNLLAHFPRYQQVVGAIEDYRAGDLDRCKASFYIGSYFENKIPDAFFADYRTTARNVVWMGYSVWVPGEDYFGSLFGYKYSGLTKLDTKSRDAKGHPGFFKFATYKGERFAKFGEWSRTNPAEFVAPFENIRLQKTDAAAAAQTAVISELVHSATGERIPYILRNRNHFYVADIPFSFMHEGDRFLIAADLLFDALDEKPLHDEKLAFVRLEDVSPNAEIPYAYDVLNIMKQEGVPVNVSLIPIFVDPLNLVKLPSRWLPMEEAAPFLQFVRDVKAQGGSFVWHGVTHQYENMRNPYSGVSSDDFEFWDAVKNAPVAKDSTGWVLRRLEDGLASLASAGIRPGVWLTPHYQASALDYLIFARVFDWNVGRTIYFDYEATGVPADSGELAFGASGSSAAKRADAFRDMSVTANGGWNGQMFPYLIFGDVYGQRLIPENLGNSQPYTNEHVKTTRSIADMLDDAKRNTVLRDAWASFFFHADLLAPLADGGRGKFPGDPSDLRQLIQGIKALGYRFISADEITRKWTLAKRAPTLALAQTR